jgi:LacI family transcriptional regulator
MRPPFRVREIAQQAGLSEATVDRVLHARDGVRQSTIAEVEQAIADLTRQQSQLRLNGRTFVVDLVIDSPSRFSAEVQSALEQEMPGLRPATLRSRFQFRDSAPIAEQVQILDGIAKRGSHGVILKAPDVPEINAAVSRLDGAKIPVVTLVTDLPASVRRAYVGLDNRAAGSTAAFLVHQWMHDQVSSVLVTRGDGLFRGEDEREMGFRSTLRTIAPGRRVVELLNPATDDRVRYDMVAAVLADHPEITGVYSMYAFGADRVIIDAFAAAGRRCEVFIAHDLDADHRKLLLDGDVSALLHHDLREDMRHACRIIMQEHGALPGRPMSAFSAVQVVTPYNVPPRTIV